MAFWPGENVVSATLGTIADEVRRAHIEAPATLVIGEVVRLREKLKHHQQHIGEHAGRDSLIRTIPVSIPDRPSGDTPDLDRLSLDTLSLEEESVGPAPSEKEVLQ
jgi:hypothetical protein